MADSIDVEISPIDIQIISKSEAAKLVRIRRMNPEFLEQIRQSIVHIINSGAAAKVLVARERYLALRRRIQMIAKDLDETLTIRRTRDGLVFWRASEDEIASRPTGPSPRRQRQQR